MTNVYQFKSAPVSILWAPTKKTNPAWRVGAVNGTVVEFKAPVKAFVETLETGKALPIVEGFTFRWIDVNGMYASVSIRIDAKRWHDLKKRGQLGMLYGVDVSNAVYRHDPRIYATNPTVDDSRRAKNGFKMIQLTYQTVAGRNLGENTNGN